MSMPKVSSRQAARFALRLDRRTHNHQSTSYGDSGGASSSPAKEKLSWLDFPDDRWPSDVWIVGADLDPALLPDFWTFLTEGGVW
jgi:hypothetical protein